MGLSSDPDKRARQLANLDVGRRKAAENLLGSSTEKPRSDPPSSAEPSAEDVHRYPGPDPAPEPPEPAPDGTTDPPAPSEPGPGPDRHRRARRAAGFLEGLRLGADI